MFNLILTPKQTNLIARVILDTLATGYWKLSRFEEEIALSTVLFQTEVNWSRNELRFVCDSLNRYSSRYNAFEEELSGECTNLFNYLLLESRGVF